MASSTMLHVKPLPMPMTRRAIQTAVQFAAQQTNPQKKQQVYLNTLAVWAVHDYLQLMEIDTNLSKSDSCNPLVRQWADVADLPVRGLGKLECRPVLACRRVEQPDALSSPICRVPPEVWDDRIGYVVVEIDEHRKQATILGFAKTAGNGELFLNQLESVHALLEHLEYLAQPEVNLSQWLNNSIDAGWQTLEELLSPHQLAFNFRSATQIETSQTENLPQGVKRGKLLCLGQPSELFQVALVVELSPKAFAGMSIWVKLYPTGSQTLLPPELQLMVLDEADIPVMQAEARNTENIQLRFSGSPGERFSIKVALGEFSLTEAFVI